MTKLITNAFFLLVFIYLNEANAWFNSEVLFFSHQKRCHFLEHDVFKELAFLEGILQNIETILENINTTERGKMGKKRNKLNSLVIKKITAIFP